MSVAKSVPASSLVVLGLLSIAVGTLVVVSPVAVALGLVGTLVAWSSIHVFRGMRLYQAITILALAGYVVLSYGFANWALRIGSIPLPIGHTLAFGALAIALRGRGRDVAKFFREPLVRIWIGLLLLSILHLLVDIPRFGAYAIRDVSFVIEGVFLLLGYLWASQGRQDVHNFLRMLGSLFALNLLYAFMFPIREALRAISPTSGIFQQVPVLGFYHHMPFFLVMGALYWLLLGEQLDRRGRPFALVIAVVSVGWSLVFQQRSMYLGMMVVMLILLVLERPSTSIKAASGVALGIVILFTLVAAFEVRIPGRIGVLEPQFFVDHFRSIFLQEGTPAEATARWRLDLLPEILDSWTATPSSIFLGEGFGEPLIDFLNRTGVAVRQPHNTHITFLARLGLIGMLFWLLFNVVVLRFFWSSLLRLRKKSLERAVILWFFLFYVLGMILTTVQPWLEFSYGAIPFFLLVGFALGYVKQLQDSSTTRQLPVGGKPMHPLGNRLEAHEHEK